MQIDDEALEQIQSDCDVGMLFSVHAIIYYSFPSLRRRLRSKVSGSERAVHITVDVGFEDPVFKSAFETLFLRRSLFELLLSAGLRKVVFFDPKRRGFFDIDLDTFDWNSLDG